MLHIITLLTYSIYGISIEDQALEQSHFFIQIQIQYKGL